MRTSPQGIAAIAAHEGFVPGPYWDSVNVLTIYVGHTAAAGAPVPAALPMGMPSDLDAAIAEGMRVFARDLAKYEAAVSAAIKVPVAQHEFDAAVSFHYNTGAIGRATWVAALNRGDRAAAAAGFMNWLHPPEIQGRRAAEQALFAKGFYPNKPMTVWRVDATGRVIWKPAATIPALAVAKMVAGAPVDAPALASRPVAASGEAFPVVKPAQEYPERPGPFTRIFHALFG